MPIIEVVQRIEVPDIPDIELPYDDGAIGNQLASPATFLGDVLHQHWPERTIARATTCSSTTVWSRLALGTIGVRISLWC